MGAWRKKPSDGWKSNRKRERAETRTVVIWPVSTWNMLSLNFKMKATDRPRAAGGREQFSAVSFSYLVPVMSRVRDPEQGLYFVLKGLKLQRLKVNIPASILDEISRFVRAYINSPVTSTRLRE